MSVIGKRFGDSGLRDLLIESRIIGSGSVNGVLEGKHYNRALGTIRLVLVIISPLLSIRKTLILIKMNKILSDISGCYGGFIKD